MLDRVAGLCPMGCGATLVLKPSDLAGTGVVTCNSLDCARPRAVFDLLWPAHVEHQVTLDDDTFAVVHPLAERFDGLLACPLDAWLRALDTPPAAPGSYIAYPEKDKDSWRFHAVAEEARS